MGVRVTEENITPIQAPPSILIQDTIALNSLLALGHCHTELGSDRKVWKGNPLLVGGALFKSSLSWQRQQALQACLSLHKLCRKSVSGCVFINELQHLTWIIALPVVQRASVVAHMTYIALDNVPQILRMPMTPKVGQDAAVATDVHLHHLHLVRRCVLLS
eukprot:117810-Amphidinium_carterae.3